MFFTFFSHDRSGVSKGITEGCEFSADFCGSAIVSVHYFMYLGYIAGYFCGLAIVKILSLFYRMPSCKLVFGALFVLLHWLNTNEVLFCFVKNGIIIETFIFSFQSGRSRGFAFIYFKSVEDAIEVRTVNSK